MNIYIYGLYNSFSSKIRYVGKTSNIQRRINEHITEAKSGKYKHFPKNKWILKTLNKGGKIFAKIIEITDETLWEEKEVYWISIYKKLGNNLNISKGGETSHSNIFLSYDDCKKWVRENIDLNTINSQSKWFNYVRTENILPDFIPRKPDNAYHLDGFNWYDFLNKNGTNYSVLKRNYLKPDEIINFVKKNNIKTISDLRKKIENENITNIPRNISRYFAMRGIDVSTVFEKYFTFEEFLKYLKTNFPELKSPSAYFRHHKNMDKKAPFYYKQIYNYIENIDDILFKEKMSYIDCKRIVNEHCIKTPSEYRIFNKNNPSFRLPKHPEVTYKKTGWSDWQSFLGVVLPHSRKNCSFEAFCRYMKMFHSDVRKSTHYIKMMRSGNISKRIPRRPDIKYKMTWEKLFNNIR